MAATWRLTFVFKKNQNSLETWYVYRFSGSVSLLELSAVVAAILVLSILINRSYFQLIGLKHGIYSHCMSGGVFECLHIFFAFYVNNLILWA